MKRHAVLAVLLACAAATSCSEGKAPPSFEVSVETPYHPGVPALNMRVDLRGASRTAADLDAVGEAVRRLGKTLHDGREQVKGDYSVVTFTVHTDRPKADSSLGDKLMHLSFDRSELQQAAGEGANGDIILGLANDAGWWTPHNDDVINDYCARPRKDAFCPRFYVNADGTPR